MAANSYLLALCLWEPLFCVGMRRGQGRRRRDSYLRSLRRALKEAGREEGVVQQRRNLRLVVISEKGANRERQIENKKENLYGLCWAPRPINVEPFDID